MALADAYHRKSRICEDLVDHHTQAGDMRTANQYRISAAHWRAKARELRNA
jgi:hypothetical protein